MCIIIQYVWMCMIYQRVRLVDFLCTSQKISGMNKKRMFVQVAHIGGQNNTSVEITKA